MSHEAISTNALTHVRESKRAMELYEEIMREQLDYTIIARENDDTQEILATWNTVTSEIRVVQSLVSECLGKALQFEGSRQYERLSQRHQVQYYSVMRASENDLVRLNSLARFFFKMRRFEHRRRTIDFFHSERNHIDLVLKHGESTGKFLPDAIAQHRAMLDTIRSRIAIELHNAIMLLEVCVEMKGFEVFDGDTQNEYRKLLQSYRRELGEY